MLLHQRNRGDELEDKEIENAKLRAVILLLLDCVDYTSGACGVTELVGAVLPQNVITQAREALKKQPCKDGEDGAAFAATGAFACGGKGGSGQAGRGGNGGHATDRWNRLHCHRRQGWRRVLRFKHAKMVEEK